jgi:hypothetical protein
LAGLAGADLGIPADFAQPGGERYEAGWFPIVPTWDNHELGADRAVCWVRPQTLPISACADGACAPADFLWLGPPAAHPTVESLQRVVPAGDLGLGHLGQMSADASP